MNYFKERIPSLGYHHDSNRPLEKSIFAMVGLLFCLLLAFRPIPDIMSANDTVRYVNQLERFCSGSLEHKLINKDLSYNFFYSVNYSACITNMPGVFLFQVALFIPLIFLLFSRWKTGTFLWGCSLLFSVYGLELMTNAMRQSLSLLLLCGALSIGGNRKYRLQSFFVGIMAVVAHTSALVFLPLLLWCYDIHFSRRFVFISLLFALILLASSFGYIIPLYDELQSLKETFSKIYANSSNVSFLLFMIIPTPFVYFLRYTLERNAVSIYEKKVFYYSMTIIVGSLLLFPLITYRFCLSAFVLQVFVISLGERQSIKVAWYAFIGMVIHLLIMLLISDHFEVLLYG